MNLTIEKTLLTLLSLTICLSIGAPLIITGINLLDQSHEIIEIETLIQQLDTEIRYLENYPDKIINLEIFIPSTCNLQTEGNRLRFVYTYQTQINTRDLIYSKTISIEGRSNTGIRSLYGYCANNVIYLVIT